ncbi:prepilin peptidase [Agromyces intestinalis]|uniref:Prepilin peptidase n=1 Tax=Agromyces intestinalis TaxID=2592652 RepID=A0A5C1YDE6_9MICO|nr:A24 family peptidase [Agromyces intestinalis]QEO14123.1 prepilin peptidase [Agromyces intestinalis]
MPVATSAIVLIAGVLGGVIGWWPLAAWTERQLRDDRMQRRTVRVVASLTTAVVWGVVTWRFADADGLAVLPAILAFTAASTVLSIVDLVEHRLPNPVVLATLVIVGALLVVASAVSGRWLSLAWALAGLAAMFGVYLLLGLLVPNAMGMGDVKLAAPIGMLLGWFGLTTWVVGLVAAFLVGGVIAIAALALRRVSWRGSIPFGPAMLAGALISLLVTAG